MNFLIDNWYLVLAAAVSGGMLAAGAFRGGASRGGLGVQEAVRIVNREKGVLIDVSETSEYAAGHATGSRNIPLAELSGHKSLPSNKALPLVLLCQSGARAARAAKQLREAGYAQVHVVDGGLRAWREANLPIVKD